ncbi:aldehyde dehydrogenase family protein [Arthrobacter sp. 24S4-2]|uniref:aldehyde dehydrogenase family protein n=1 Tax=Arthrobacter sp. 24S4-2 TaxID=2575374 RepID=UPI0020C7CA0F
MSRQASGGLLNADSWKGNLFGALGWEPAAGGDIAVIEKATGRHLAWIGQASKTDVLTAASRAAVAQRGWAAAPYEERAAILRAAGEALSRHASEIEHWIVREAGAVPVKAASEVYGAVLECQEAAALPSFPSGRVLPTGAPRWSFARRRPAGVVSVIAPFNTPLFLAIRSVAPALALGNSVLLKPDPRTPISGGAVIVAAFQAAGLPAGVLQLLLGGAGVGEALVTAPEVRIVSFTGSTLAGRSVARLAGEHLKRAHLELGGNGALIILPGADLTKAAAAGSFGSFMHQGQICMTTGRHLVHESLHSAYVEALVEEAQRLTVGNPATEQVALGPVIDEVQVARINRLVTSTVAAGARLATGGTHEGLFYRPTVLAGVTPEMPAYAEEVFGPVAPVVPFATVDEAIALAGDTEYGLSLGILGDVGMAMEVADSIPCGIIHINEQTIGDEANAPFGGVRASGNGSRFGGRRPTLRRSRKLSGSQCAPTLPPIPSS